MASMLLFCGVAAAQQAVTAPEQSVTPAVPSAAQPLPQTTADQAADQNNPAKTDAAKDAADSSPTMRLGAGDMLDINVYNVPELAAKARVSSSGDVYLPLIDYVHLDGLTVEEAQALIEKRLGDGGFVRSPHVTVLVTDAASQGVTILGEVAKPGIYPNTSDHKLYELISEAGGFASAASRKIAILRRNQKEPIRVDLPRNLADDVSRNVDIQAGDTITVPRAPIIYVVGDVSRPSGLLVDNGQLTVLQALALAGGTNKTAKLGSCRILRKGPNGMVETKIEIKKMLEAKAPDVTLQADDILFVPVSGGKVLAGRTFEAAMNAATAVTIYTVRP